MTPQQLKIAERYARAELAWESIRMRNVSGISIERRVEMAIETAKVEAEVAAAGREYRKMIDEMANAS